MKRIYKYSLVSPILMPKEHRVLDIQLQDGSFVLWAEVNPDSPIIEKTVHSPGTGAIPPSDLPWFATRQDGPFVWHFYLEPRGRAADQGSG